PYYTISPTYSICKVHGYIAGEHETCPTCGEKAEIYSRITGYYRPVNNWNDGKAQEFKDRVTYKIDGNCSNEVEKETSKKKENKRKQNAESAMLFVTKTCPNCRVAKRALTERKIAYTIIDA